MDRYSRRNLEDLVVPNYHETSDSYPSPDVWGGWNLNSSEAAEKSFDYDLINNGFIGGLYNHLDMDMDMEMGTSPDVKEEATRSEANGCFDHTLHDFNGIQQMDDLFLSSILEDVPGNGNFHSESNTNNPGSSTAYLDTLDGREVPMHHFDWETCQYIPTMEEAQAPMIPCEEVSAEEVVLQDLQRATEKLTDGTRMCLRDTFYRLAKNSQNKSESGNTNSEEFLEDALCRNRKQETELETNSIDRAVANLTFNKMESNMRNLPPPNRLSSIQG